MAKARAPFTFVDLFAGIGGFHAALGAMGGKCVYAVEIDPKAAAVYEKNWGLNPLGDITQDVTDENVLVPPHDVLVAGFPCQPFSKSGAQRGMEETRGTLYWSILKIIQEHHPTLVVLENVRNLAGPRHIHEWEVIVATLRAEGYLVASKPAVFSPHLLPRELGGRPQSRERVFVVAVKGEGESPVEPVVDNHPVNGWKPENWNLTKGLPMLSRGSGSSVNLTEIETHWIDAWNDFVEEMLLLRRGQRLPGFPLWGDSWVHKDELVIPSGTPLWKQDFLIKNADFYTEHQEFIDGWAAKWNFYSDLFPASRRKLEWQAQDCLRLWDTIMHFRPSGIRAKKPTYVPALVAITQTTIVGPRKRRLSPREAARLQGLPDWFDFGDQPDSTTYRQLGNGVNIGAVWYVIRQAVRNFENEISKVSPRLTKAVLSAPENPDDALLRLQD